MKLNKYKIMELVELTIESPIPIKAPFMIKNFVQEVCSMQETCKKKVVVMKMFQGCMALLQKTISTDFY